MSSQPSRIWVKHLGCKVNLADLAAIIDRLPADCCRVVEDAKNADVVLLNTCTVTHKADREVRKILGSLMRDHPHLSVVVTGCGAAINRTELSRFGNVRAVIRPGDLEAIHQAVLSVPATGRDFSGISSCTSSFMRLGRQRALVKVQDGCDTRCAYCIVPRARGPERSVAINQVIDRVGALTALDHHEVVLTGVNLGRYGIGLEPPVSLAGLLRALSPLYERLGHNFRLRLSSIEPLEWSHALMDVLSQSGFVCAHFHIPMQSGDDTVLQRMRRPYRAEQFRQVVLNLRRRFPSAALGTDILVGFPGETEEAAHNTYRMVQSLPLSYLHVFAFSPRPGTPAEKMPHQVASSAIHERSAALRRLGRELWQKFLAQGIGRIHQVLIERQTPAGLYGRANNYRRFWLDSGSGRCGQVVEVMAECLDADGLVGVVSIPSSSRGKVEHRLA